jgi:hypothetical protein
MPDLPADLRDQLRRAVTHFWSVRGIQAGRQGGEAADKDRGDRAAVTGGKHLDGFLTLVASLLEGAGLRRSHIYWQERTELPGWFRAEKTWDLLVVADGKLVAIAEFKSQVGSFGNNFNNRTEEAVGNATDLWEAYEKGAFKPSQRPWLGYLMLLEDTPEVKTPVKVREPHFQVFPEFKGASYLERYNQLLTRLVRKRLYDAGCLLLSPKDGGGSGTYGEPNPELGFGPFVTSLFAKAAAVAQMQPPGPPAPPTVESGPPSESSPVPKSPRRKRPGRSN